MARKATQQEAKAYNLIVHQALMFLHQPDQAAQLKQMASQGDPAEALATATAAVLKQVLMAAKQGGKNIPPNFYLPAASEIMQHLLEMLVSVFKIVPAQSAGQVLAKAKQVFQQVTNGGQ